MEIYFLIKIKNVIKEDFLSISISSSSSLYCAPAGCWGAGVTGYSYSTIAATTTMLIAYNYKTTVGVCLLLL